MHPTRSRLSLLLAPLIALGILAGGCSTPKPTAPLATDAAPTIAVGDGLDFPIDTTRSSLFQLVSQASEEQDITTTQEATVDSFVVAQDVTLPKQPKGYTLMVYMVGSDLETNHGCASMDLQEMLGSGLDAAKANIVVFTGGSNTWHANIPNDRNCVLEVADGGGKIVAATTDLFNMGEASTLASFVAWTRANYPAEHTALVLWDHGAGPTGGYGFDQVYQYDSLSLPEMEGAMKSAGIGEGNKLDWVGFDACLMGSFEVLEAWQDYADYFVGSEEIEDGHGWNYAFLQALNSSDDAQTVTNAVVDSFAQYYDLTAGVLAQPNYTLAAVDLSQVKAVGQALDGLSDALLADFAQGDFVPVARARENCRSFGAESGLSLVDMGDLVNLLAEHHPAEAEAMRAAMDQAIIKNASNLTGANGISLCFPVSQLTEDFVAPTERYGRMVEAYAAQVSATEETDWTFPEIEIGEGIFSIALDQSQSRGLVTASYTVLKSYKGEGYYPVMSNVRINPDEANTLHIPLDPQVIITSGTTDEVPFEQTDASPARQTYRCEKVSLLPGEEFVDVVMSTQNIDLTIAVDPSTQEVSVASVAYDDETAPVGGRSGVRLSDYKSLMYVMGILHAPQRGDDGSLLPYQQWNADNDTVVSMQTADIGDTFLFETSSVSQIPGDYALQVVLTDVAGNQHASELIPLEGLARRTATVELADGTLTFDLYEDHAELASFVSTKDGAVVAVPAEVEGLPVTTVAPYALKSDFDVQELTLPSSVTEIGEGALHLFSATHVDLGGNVTTIGNRALCHLSHIEQLELPTTLRSIGRGALRSLGATSLTIPASVEHVGEGALTHCGNLERFDVEAGCTAVREIDGVLFTEGTDGLTLLAFPAGRTGSYETPKGTVAIGYGAFAGTLATSFVIGEGVKKIDACAFYHEAFYDDTRIEAIQLPDSLEYIGYLAFGSVYHVTSSDDKPLIDTVHLGKNVSYIGPEAFTALKVKGFEVDPANTTFASSEGFLTNKAGDTVLQAPLGAGSVVVVPSGITTLPDLSLAAFGANTAFVLPASVSRISSEAFYYTTTGETDTDGKPVRSYGISIHCDEGTVAEQFALKHGITYDHETDPGKLVHEEFETEVDGVTYAYQLYADHAVLHRVDGSGASAPCPLVIPREVEGVPVTAIDALASSQKSGDAWTSVSLPPTLESLDYNAIPSLVSDEGFAFDGTSDHFAVQDGVLFSADGKTLVAFALHGPHATDEAAPFTYSIPEGTREIGPGAFYESHLEDVTFPASLRTVGTYAFTSCYHLAALNLNEGLERIESYAFYGCGATTVSLPDSVVFMGDNCLRLEGYDGFTLPEKLRELGAFVLYQASYPDDERLFPLGSDTLHIGKRLTEIGQSSLGAADIMAFEVDESNPAFASIDGLLVTSDLETLLRVPAGRSGELHIPDGIQYLEADCLGMAPRITDVYFPDSVVSARGYYTTGRGSLASTVTFHCKAGSPAATYAQAHGIAWTEE